MVPIEGGGQVNTKDVKQINKTELVSIFLFQISYFKLPYMKNYLQPLKLIYIKLPKNTTKM